MVETEVKFIHSFQTDEFITTWGLWLNTPERDSRSSQGQSRQGPVRVLVLEIGEKERHHDQEWGSQKPPNGSFCLASWKAEGQTGTPWLGKVNSSSLSKLRSQPRVEQLYPLYPSVWWGPSARRILSRGLPHLKRKVQSDASSEQRTRSWIKKISFVYSFNAYLFSIYDGS